MFRKGYPLIVLLWFSVWASFRMVASGRNDMKLTPVLFVDAIEPSLPFWLDRLGFQKTVEVPEGDRLGFVILVKDQVEVMLQTWRSLEKDLPALLPSERTTGASLYIEIEDFEKLKKDLSGYEILIPERTTEYGMKEIGVREPGGHTLLFASPAQR